MRKYVSEVNDSIRDARRQLVGYLLEKDKVWFENRSERHKEKKETPRRKKQDWAIKTRKKETHLSRAAKPRKGRSDRGIFGAVAKGCLSEIEKTLKDNDINALNSSRETLLHVAAANGHLAVMEYLISRGAKPDVKDKKGRTPLHRAAEKGHGDAVKVAALKDESSLVERLLKSGASVDGKDERGQTALSYALSQGFENTAKVAFNSNNPSIFKVLLEYSKDLPSNLMEFLWPCYNALRRTMQFCCHLPDE
uniref:Uncharacterized protein n=1 Tax=Anas zonorhyncha TaxID=75864 RepID=A0A8B9V461_9AVES